MILKVMSIIIKHKEGIEVILIEMLNGEFLSPSNWPIIKKRFKLHVSFLQRASKYYGIQVLVIMHQFNLQK